MTLGVCPSDALLAKYVEGLVTPNERDKIEEHLAECRRCRTIIALVLKLFESGPPGTS